MPRKPKIAFVGAGSTVFTRNLVGDVPAACELSGSTLAVMDIDPERHGLRQTIADTLGAGGFMRAPRAIPVLLDVCRDMDAGAGP